MATLRAIAIRGMPEVRRGDSLADILLDALRRQRLKLEDGDILVIKQKVVSKAEGRLVRLETVRPSARARRWAAATGHDARLAELALREARRVLRMKHVLITETRHGLVCANSGVDVSNVDGGRSATLLPRDADASARRLLWALRRRLRLHIPVIVSDSFGRPWREGLTEVAIGVAGMKALHDYRGQRDPDGYPLRVSIDAVADELACAAGLVCGKLARTPACLIRGFRYQPARGRATDLLRPASQDLFR